MITPPVGLNVFVIKSVVDGSIRLETIFRGVSYFLVAELIVVVLMIAFPQIVLLLPRMFN